MPVTGSHIERQVLTVSQQVVGRIADTEEAPANTGDTAIELICWRPFSLT
jgi:hypothetical protein